MNIGTIVFATDTGLGNQTKEFYDHMKPYKSLLVDLSRHNGMPIHREWYQDDESLRVTNGIPLRKDFDWLIDGADILFFCEAPLNYQIYDMANSAGVPTVQQYNYEFLDYLRDKTIARPTVFAGPSTWMLEKMKREFGEDSVAVLRVPTNTSKINYRPYPEEVPTAVHIAGRHAINDRNGTDDYLDSIQYMPKHFRHIIYGQRVSPGARRRIEELERSYDRDVQYRGSVENYVDLYSEGDVLVLPRRYGGLCLPMQEALAAGMPVIMTDISPNDDILDPRWLVPAEKTGSFMGREPIDVYSSKPEDIAETVTSLLSPIEMAGMHRAIARFCASRVSWDTMVEEYNEFFKYVVTHHRSPDADQPA